MQRFTRGVRRAESSRLIFNQENVGSSPTRPIKTLYVDRSSIMAERCAVNAVGAGSSPADQPNLLMAR